MKEHVVDVIHNEIPNEKGISNELVIYNQLDMNNFIMSSGVVPAGFDFSTEYDMREIKDAVTKDRISEEDLNKVSNKIAKRILEKQPLIANGIKDSTKEKDIQPVIPREPSYIG